MSRSNNNSELTIKINPTSLLWLAVIGLALYALFLLYELLLATITAVVIAAAISPVARWFVAHRIPRVVAVLIIYATVAIVLTVSFYFLFLPLLAEALTFVNRLPEYLSEFEAWNPLGEGGAWLETYPALRDLTEGITIKDMVDQTREFFAGLGTGFIGALTTLFGGVFSLIIITVLSFYMTVQENGVVNFIKTVTPSKYETYVLDLWRRTELKIGLWLQGQLVLAVLVAVLVYLGLALLGVPHALLLAALAGLMELIPVFGPILAAIPAIVVGFSMDGGGLSTALIVTGFYIIIQQFESQLIYPLVVQKVVGLSPIIVILALAAGYILGGFLGILLSVPASAFVMELVNDLQKNKQNKAPAERPAVPPIG